MYHSAVGAFVLEVEEPVFFSVGGVDPSALVGAVDVGQALFHYVAGFIGAPDVFRAKHFLPSGGYASGGGEDVVPTVALVEFCAFDGFVFEVSVIDHFVLADGLFAVRGHLDHAEDALDTGAAAGIAVAYVGASVFVPDGARVNDSFGFVDVDERFPGACGVFGLGHEDAQIGITIIYIEFAVVVADGGSPYGVAVAGVFGRLSVFGHFGDCVAYKSPVDQIF